jgi:hypothetical protein
MLAFGLAPCLVMPAFGLATCSTADVWASQTQLLALLYTLRAVNMTS